MKNNGYLADSFKSIFDDFRNRFNFRYIIYRLKWVLFPKFHIVSEFPTCLNIETTNACNLKCVY